MHSEDIYCRYLAVFIHRQAKYCILWSHLTELPHNVFMHVLTGPQRFVLATAICWWVHTTTFGHILMNIVLKILF